MTIITYVYVSINLDSIGMMPSNAQNVKSLWFLVLITQYTYTNNTNLNQFWIIVTILYNWCWVIINAIMLLTYYCYARNIDGCYDTAMYNLLVMLYTTYNIVSFHYLQNWILHISQEDATNEAKPLFMLQWILSSTRFLELCYGLLLYHGCYLWWDNSLDGCNSPLRIMAQIQVVMMCIRLGYMVLFIGLGIPPILSINNLLGQIGDVLTIHPSTVYLNRSQAVPAVW